MWYLHEESGDYPLWLFIKFHTANGRHVQETQSKTQ